MASVQSLAEPRQRATAVAIVMFCSAILGQGLGPFGIGAGSDWLGNFYGVDGLRYAMIGSSYCLFGVFCTSLPPTHH